MVEWKKLGDLGTFIRGTGIQKSDFVDDGYPCIHYGQIHTKYGISTEKTISFISEELYKKSKKAVKGDVVLATTSEDAEGVAKPVAWLGDNDVAISGDAFIFHHNQNGKYLAHVFASHRFNLFKVKHVSGTKVVRITGDSMAKFEFPLPPLSEQNRIVGILDTFTESIENLKKQISERKKQYEHYRDQLLDLEGKPGVEMKTVKDLCKNICSGGTPSTSHKEYYNGNIPWLRTQEVDWKNIYDTEIKITNEAIANSSAKLIPVNCVIVAMYGATAAKVAINKIPLCTNQACCNLEIDNRIAIYKYVYQWLCKEYYRIKSMGEGSQNNINGKKIKEYQIPLPSIEEQNRIVTILDTFEASIANLEQQLTHRQKQYEYYRNMLLTFDE